MLTRGGDTGVTDAPVTIVLQAHWSRCRRAGRAHRGSRRRRAAAAWHARGYGPGYVPGACQGRAGGMGAWGHAAGAAGAMEAGVGEENHECKNYRAEWRMHACVMLIHVPGCNAPGQACLDPACRFAVSLGDVVRALVTATQLGGGPRSAGQVAVRCSGKIHSPPCPSPGCG